MSTTHSRVTGSIYPWTGHSPDHGGIIANYLVKLNVQDMSWRRYVSDLLHGRYSPSDTTYCFHKGFPTAKGSKLSLMDYLIDVVQHGKDWGLFIPQLHTLEVNNPLGFYPASLLFIYVCRTSAGFVLYSW